jgi:hypothetical protein
MPFKDKEKAKAYRNKYMKEVWYPKNRTKHINSVKILKSKLTNYLDEFKRKGLCADCGFSGKEYPGVLEFDHLKDKKFEISAFAKYILSLASLKEEMAKCDLVCANCHRIRTINRRT